MNRKKDKVLQCKVTVRMMTDEKAFGPGVAELLSGVQRQWIMSQTAPGAIAARQQARDHVVEVRINYSASGYSIHYVSSSNMLASGGKIHKNYNRWVHNLDKDIQVNLAADSSL